MTKSIALSLVLAATAPLQQVRAQNGSDDLFAQMKHAAQRGDKARLSALLPQARGTSQPNSVVAQRLVEVAGRVAQRLAVRSFGPGSGGLPILA